MVADLQHYQQRLADAQRAAGRLRCEAFVDYSPVVAGQRLNQITLPSYNRLCAFECAFVCGGPITFRDIVCFIWVQHPQFQQFNAKAKTRVTHEVFRFLNPRFGEVQNLIRFLTPIPKFRWLNRWRRPTAMELHLEAVEEIQRLVKEGLSEFPRDEPSEGSEPLPFSFQAQVLNLMRRSLGLSFAETGAIPLKALAQHLREIVHSESKGKLGMMTAEEKKVWADYLDWRQSQVRTESTPQATN